MSGSKKIHIFLNSVKQTRLILHAFYSLSSALLVTLALFALHTGLKKLVFYKIPYEDIFFGVLLAGTFISCFMLRFRRIASRINNAIYVDTRFELKDRFSSYIDCVDRELPLDIISYQENALITILPRLTNEKKIDLKKHYSFKYILIFLFLVVGLTYIDDKTPPAPLLTKQESRILKKQEENLNKFVAFLKKNKEKANKKQKQNINEFNDIVKDAIKKFKKAELDKKNAMKLLSKLVDKSQEMLDNKDSETPFSDGLANIDTNKFKSNSKFEEFMKKKKEELKRV